MYLIRHHLMRLRSLRGKTIVHVGAHRGQEAQDYQKWGAARVIWVEADPETARGLRQHLASLPGRPQGWLQRLLGFPATEHRVIEALIGDEDGKLTDFHVFSNDGESSSIFRKAAEADARHAAIVETGTVRQLAMRSLDRLLPENGIPLASVDILVLDVQGAELLCLRGATSLLSHVTLLESEVATTPWYEGGVLLPELDAWLAAKGFQRRTRVRRSMMNAVYTR
ncbi:MAG: FkbM family methyltransferase [Paracoccaceae bacterium]